MKRWLGLVLCVAACGEGEGEFEQAATAVEGIYQVQTYTRNEQACSSGGVDAIDNDRFAVAVQQQLLGQRFLSVVSCASAIDCRAKLDDIRAGHGYTLEFQFVVSEADGDLLRGAGASTGFGSSGTCTRGEVTATTLELVGTSLAIEKRITVADDYPADSDGFCTTELTRKYAEGNACSQLEVLTAALVEVL